MSCPSESQIFGYVQGALSEEERTTLEAHFATCDECRKLVSALGRSSQPDAERAPVVHDVIDGKYRVEGIVGAGGMGFVARATHLTLGEPVAIKILRRDLSGVPGATDRFLREARACVRIKSEHVVRVHDTGKLSNGAPYMVMELLEGKDLAALLDTRGAWAVSEVADAMLHAMDAIAEAHALGIVHRDLKPSNLFLTERRDGSPLVKVLDFGISKMMDSDGASSTFTTGETLLGSPRYMSPEQMRSTRDVDHRTDVWALGVIMHELLTATPPFEAPNTAGLCAAILTRAPAPLRTLRPDAPVALEDVILRCLEKEPARRFQSMSELAAAVTPFATRATAGYAERIARLFMRIRGAAGSPERESAPPTGTMPMGTRVRVDEVDPRAVTQATPTEVLGFVTKPHGGGVASQPPPRSSQPPLAYLPSVVPASARRSGPPPPTRKGRRWLWLAGFLGLVGGGAGTVLALNHPLPPEPDPVITTSTRASLQPVPSSAPTPSDDLPSVPTLPPLVAGPGANANANGATARAPAASASSSSRTGAAARPAPSATALPEASASVVATQPAVVVAPAPPTPTFHTIPLPRNNGAQPPRAQDPSGMSERK